MKVAFGRGKMHSSLPSDIAVGSQAVSTAISFTLNSINLDGEKSMWPYLPVQPPHTSCTILVQTRFTCDNKVRY